MKQTISQKNCPRGTTLMNFRNSKMEAKDEVSVTVQQEQTDVHLDDDRQPQEGQFVGATLKIDGDLVKDEHEVKFSGTTQTGEPSEPTSGFDRNRPGSTIGRQSVLSTSSRTSLRPGGHMSQKTSDKFFSYKVITKTCQNLK